MFSIRGPKMKIFAALLAVICLAAGVYFTFFQSQGFVKTTAAIIDVEANLGGADEGTTYTPTVEYAVDGKTYTAKLDTASSSYRVGKTISVMYDPNDPAVVHDGGGFGVYLIIVSALILVVIIVSAVREKQSQRQAKELREASGQTGYAPSVKGAERELYFLTDTGTPKYGHRIEDKDRKVLYEAKMTRFSLTTPFGFDFIDHEHGTTTPHLVGHQEETERNGIFFDSHYTFDFDGEEIWKHLKRNSVSVETERMEGAIWPRFRVLRGGEEIAVLESSSRFVHEEDAESHGMMNKVAAPGYYRIWTRETNLDLVFVTAMAFARSGALNDEGGTFGKMMRQSLKKEFGRQ